MLRRILALVVLIVLPLATTGCGLALTHGPPAGHESMMAFNCTESNTGPILDIVWGGLNGLGAAAIASDRESYEDPDLSIASGIGWGVLSSVSAGVGFSKTRKCRDARRALEARLRSGMGMTGDSMTAATVSILPVSDTLSVGQQRQLVATANASSGRVIPGAIFVWTSSIDAVASVNASGLVTAHAPGTIVIAARSGTATGTARIVVR